jgi:hypothetical protein
MSSEPASAPVSPMVEPPSASLRPRKLETIGIMMLISGIINILWGLGASVFMFINIVVGGIASFGLGCLCFPILLLPLLQLVLGVFEIIYGSRLMSPTSDPLSYGRLQTVTILEMVCIISGNIFSLVIGILNLIFMGEPPVQEYYHRA